jgi:hypothetical protein
VKFGFSRIFQLHRPESNPVILIALLVACNPLLDTRALIGSGIIAHGFGIAQDPGQIMSIVGSEFAEDKPRCLEDWHHLDYVAVRALKIVGEMGILRQLCSTDLVLRFVSECKKDYCFRRLFGLRRVLGV